MKRRIFIVFMLIITLMIPSIANAEGKNKVYGGDNTGITVDGMVGCNIDSVAPVMSFRDGNGKKISGSLGFPNWDNTKEGLIELQWVFTPDDQAYEIKTGILNINLKPIRNDNGVEETTTPSLTASTVLLNTMTTYDINLVDKVSGSTYEWTSSDTDIVEVNTKSGLLRAKNIGNANVTCEITLPDTSTQTLTSEIVVGFDENAPLLTESVLDLDIGDLFDINLENKIAKSTYRWATSDRTIVKVNSSNGKVTAISEGEAFITCTITTPDKQIIVLKCNINVTVPNITE